MEIDREFVQYYHRRICWLALKEYHRAAEDADHTLKLMDFSTAHSPDENWSLMHEQYRPFVLFHRTQALALTELEETDPEKAVATIYKGLGEPHDGIEGLPDPPNWRAFDGGPPLPPPAAGAADPSTERRLGTGGHHRVPEAEELQMINAALYLLEPDV